MMKKLDNRKIKLLIRKRELNIRKISKKNAGKNLDNVNDEFEVIKDRERKNNQNKRKKIRENSWKNWTNSKDVYCSILKILSWKRGNREKKNKNRLISEEENEKEEKEEDEIKLAKNKKWKKRRMEMKKILMKKQELKLIP